ncbi:SH3 domain-containing protein [Roseovarius sp. EL26]|uniref:SH3 domain-containing protein n=1 Tax=Roseovarius sp. EL26 TaxID=2126672 RepID=UPI0013C5271A|nr:SH3 domain-containing protein [Roseovarius sp. EL26]
MGLLRMILALGLALWGTSSAVQAVELELRPDLGNRLSKLQQIYRPTEWSETFVDLPPNRREIDRASLNSGGSVPWKIVHLSGVIELGDLNKLKQFVKEVQQGQHQVWTLVLDSDGGNFLEGIAIGEWLRENLSSQDPDFHGSYVLAGDECLSACGLIFALSSHRRSLNDSDSSRFIELGARVGFHMGFLSGKLASQKIELSDAMNLTYDIMAAYMVLISDQTSPPDLIVEALKARDAETFFYVEASDRAYDLGFIPVSAGPLSEPLTTNALSMSHVYQMCARLLVISQIPETIVNEDYGFVHQADEKTVKAFFETRGGKTYRGLFASGESCLIGLSPQGNLMLDVAEGWPPCIEGDDSEANWCAVDVELSAYATNGLLADISACHMGRLHPAIYTESQVTDRYDFPEGFGLAQITREVNMRESPAFGAPVLAELETGYEFRVKDCTVTLDNQAIWLKLVANGQSGWISARFADVYYATLTQADDDFEAWIE